MRKDLGRIGEDIAERYLLNKNFVILERNFRSKRWGEIDIIARDGETIVFVEVKTRSSNRYGNPYEAVTKYKLKALRNSANYYLFTHNLKCLARIDVISINFNFGKYGINHFTNVDF
ncbi:YraN family protein [candidate division WWE3 bacterium RIFCSPHIGHO2_01_FULL_40_23]|uniref:UPF0102 protein A3A78_03130 n=1 Tax=candidate division WWE3 bacterium RIFCSPLOWO2_01_FULL_41_18 TaxID=1802625 RepID=A0A1F4VCU5_UNCKA|nr:MAG: YraN family protein [candidate division WWE3 bacterium RIFCSPHIGHO2_01_FULL_40_23]OGC54949.1 MAG: YraN family protein [candidate division WWE3 bacterium RIFCSPLOWO2_01_FULL_41_18]